MKRSRKDKTMLIAVCVLVLFAAYNFLIRPQGAALTSAQDERALVELATSDARLTLLAPADATEDPTSGDVDPGADALAIPSDPAFSTLLRQLQTIATETGMLHGSIAPTALSTNPNGPGGSLLIAISASGSADAAQRYIQRLRDLERLVVVEQIGLSVQPDGLSQLQISARVFSQQVPADPSLVAP
jgi:Tfp pilus assembly protein PilO